MNDLKKENLRLRRTISDLTLDKLILLEVLRKTSEPRATPALHRPDKEVLDVSEWRACRVLEQHRSKQRKVPCRANNEQMLTEDIVLLAGRYGR